RDHYVGGTTLDQPERFTDRMRRGRARGHGAVVGPLGTVPDRYYARRDVRDEHRNEEGRHALRPHREVGLALFLERPDAADAAADDDSGTLGIRDGLRKPGVLHRLL